MVGSETYTHSKDVCLQRDASKQCLNKMHGRENVHTPLSSKFFNNTRSQIPPFYMPNPPPPPPGKKESPPPPVNGPLSGKKNLGPGHWRAGGGGYGST